MLPRVQTLLRDNDRSSHRARGIERCWSRGLSVSKVTPHSSSSNLLSPLNVAGDGSWPWTETAWSDIRWICCHLLGYPVSNQGLDVFRAFRDCLCTVPMRGCCSSVEKWDWCRGGASYFDEMQAWPRVLHIDGRTTWTGAFKSEERGGIPPPSMLQTFVCCLPRGRGNWTIVRLPSMVAHGLPIIVTRWTVNGWGNCWWG